MPRAVGSRLVGLADEKYVLFTTCKRDGTPVATPVWVVALGDGRLAFWTSSGSGKAKRLAHTSRVTVQPSDSRGMTRPGGTVTEATAQVVSGPELEEIRRRVIAKYGVMAQISKAILTIVGTFKRQRTPYADRGVVITLP
jgi:PPOX class probable F420-dependent enzyme